MISEKSDISRTNQLKITSSLEEVAEKLYQYLFKSGKGIESFPPPYSSDLKVENEENDEDVDSEDEDTNPFIAWHREIKQKIRERLAQQGEDLKDAAPQYVMAKVDEKWQVFYLSPNKKYAGWKDSFIDKENVNYRQTILNLVFKSYLLSKLPDDFTPNEYMGNILFIHSIAPSKRGDGLDVWGQELFLNYNRHQVVTLTLSRKNLFFSKKDPSYKTFDDDDVRMLKYYDYSKKLDARRANEISFMKFPPRKDKEPFEIFKKTQLYYYQYLMTQLESFLETCRIGYTPQDFQADHYLENLFIKDLPGIDSLEIINNSGIDFTKPDKHALEHVFHDFFGVSALTFYHDGRSINTYEQTKSEEKSCWKIQQTLSWEKDPLDTGKNYLVFNKILDKQNQSSTAYQRDGFWYPKAKIENKPIVDFYSQLKRTYNYLNIEKFFSTQGVDVAEFKIISNSQKKRSILKRPKTLKETKKSSKNNINDDVLFQDTAAFTDGKLLSADDLICAYLGEQQDEEERKNFYKKYHLKLSPEFQKIFIELSIKNWMRSSVLDPKVSFPIPFKKLPEQQFFAIYVRNPRKQAKNSKKPTEKVIAVEFLYKDGNLSITKVLCDVTEIKQRFGSILRTRKNTPEELLNGRHYLVDEEKKVCISCYTDNFFTPTLIGHRTILQDLEQGKLKIDRYKDNLLPLVLHYKRGDKRKKRELREMICLDLHNKNENFIQYYVPLAGNLKAQLKDAEGFRVYHITGQTFSGHPLTTDELSKNALTMLHFSTLTQDILKISDNSQSSLLQKIATVFIEN